MTDTLYGIWGSTLTGIADAIRTKNPDVTGLVDPADMRQDILDISGGGGEPYIPREQIVCDFDFSEAEYDLVRSIISESQSDSLLLYPQLYNSSYDSTNGVVTFRNQYSMLNPMVSFEAYADYEIEIKYGDIDNQSGSYDRQLIYFTDTILLWYDGHSGRDYLYVENSSSTIVFNDLNLSSLANKTLKLFIDYSKNQVGDVIATASMQMEGENQKRVLGQIDYSRLNNDLVIGRWSSDEGMYNVDIRSVKVIKKTLKEIPDDIIQPITITENGTYTADGNTVAGYSPITVNIHEVLEGEWDLLHSGSTLGFLDIVKNVSLPTDAYSGFSNGYITDRNCSVAMHKPNHGDVKRIVVKTGAFDRSAEPSEEWLNLMRLNTDDWHFNLTYNTSGDYWRVSDATGSTIDIPASTLPKYAFEDTTFEIIYGAKYINGELYRGIKINGSVTENYTDRLYVYLNGTLVMENQYQPIYPTIRVGGGNGWIGAKFENVKIYNVLDCYEKYYEAPVSLMSPSESKSSDETESTDEKSIDELIKEDEEITKQQVE